MADNGTSSLLRTYSNIPAEWDTVTKIGYRAHQTRATTVKGNSSINAATRTGPVQTEKKFTGTLLPSPPTCPSLSPFGYLGSDGFGSRP